MEKIALYRFYAQTAISFLVLTFSMAMLAVPHKPRSNEALFASLISGIIGWWMPSPSTKKDNESQVQIDSNQTTVIADQE